MKNWLEMNIHYHADATIINFLEDEEAINITEAVSKTDWEYIFVDLPKLDVPVDYKAEMGEYDPINMHIETEIKGKKTWLNDSPKNRPDSITVYFLANDRKIAERLITAKDNWAYQFSNIPEYDAMGEKITYTVEEEAVEGYKTTYERFDIVNKRE